MCVCVCVVCVSFLQISKETKTSESFCSSFLFFVFLLCHLALAPCSLPAWAVYTRSQRHQCTCPYLKAGHRVTWQHKDFSSFISKKKKTVSLIFLPVPIYNDNRLKQSERMACFGFSKLSIPFEQWVKRKWGNCALTCNTSKNQLRKMSVLLRKPFWLKQW